MNGKATQRVLIGRFGFSDANLRLIVSARQPYATIVPNRIRGAFSGEVASGVHHLNHLTNPIKPRGKGDYQPLEAFAWTREEFAAFTDPEAPGSTVL
jgi:hypothetical protein